jgi:uncharacterized protein YbjQ (UPF0145 family)
MIVTTTENIAGYRVTKSLGQVFGIVVRSRGLGGNIIASFRSLIGGEIKEYTQMVENAEAMGANAVVMMRFDSSEIMTSMNEIVAYGTAVIAETI